ncbi:lytic transglycosylase domain-containing protein [Sulfurimonas sp. HSL-1716]|uniref:lytic transglycosylase domain-containing protein n=1 Tax=Hydrocurvibacter sulfurireducens TaxID=3131937 RepID=UPI0031F72338
MKLWILLLSTLLCAQITLEQIDSKPASRAKNFMIWQFLQQDISAKEADKAFAQIQNVNRKLFLTYAKKSDSKDVRYVAKCMTMKIDELLKTGDDNCLQIAISPAKATYFTKEQRKKLIGRVFVKKTKEYLALMSSDMSEKALFQYDPTLVLTVMIDTGKQFREKNFNRRYSKAFVNFLAKSWKISRLIDLTVTNDNMDKLQESFLLMNGDKLTAGSNFMLAMNYLKHEKKEEALAYLDTSYKKAGHQINRDKALFWKYLITNDKRYLKQVSLSMDINVYTLYAKEILHMKVQNYFTEKQESLPVNAYEKNIKDPFVWLDIRNMIKAAPKNNLFKLANKFNQPDLLPIKTFMLERAYAYRVHGFIMPYMKHTECLPKDERAFMYALMRQESHFIPSAISSSYALGLMQLMPFLVDILKEKMPNKITCYSDMFEPKNNISYAAKHLEWLDTQLDSPLLKAYAYNAGLGFVRKYIRSGKFTDKKYEPFLSMDTMSNVESREYGKKVLANYVMYKKIMGQNISIVHLFDKLKAENKNNRFAK